MSNLDEDRGLISRGALCGVTYLSQSQTVQTRHQCNLQEKEAASTACKSNFMAGSTAWVGGKSERDKWILKAATQLLLKKAFPTPHLAWHLSSESCCHDRSYGLRCSRAQDALSLCSIFHATGLEVTIIRHQTHCFTHLGLAVNTLWLLMNMSSLFPLEKPLNYKHSL